MLKVLQKFFAFSFLLLLVLSFSFGLVTTQAQGASVEDLNLLGNTCLFEGAPGCEGGTPIIDSIAEFAQTLGNTVAVVVFAWGGYKFYFSGLGAEGVGDGRKTMLSAVFGLIILNLAPTLADIFAGENGIVQDGGFDSQPIEDIIVQIRDNLLFPLSSVVAVAVIAWGGYQWMFSALPDSKADGIATLRKGIFGLIVVAIAMPLTDAISGVFGELSGDEGLNLDSAPIVDFIQAFLINLFIPASSVVAVFFVVLGGYQMLTSNGDKAKYENGLKSLLYSIYGICTVLLSSTIVGMIILFVPN